MQKYILKKRSGQISLFLAFIFPILFVFFAMTINIGLVVHDKINLQNSVDLAAYYGAAKQAEILNAIAHINYQMRQSWKLLAFRIRGFGHLGRGRLNRQPIPNMTQHPWIPNSTPGLVEQEFNTNLDQPAFVCTAVIPLWSERFLGDRRPNTPDRDNPCSRPHRTLRAIYVPKPILVLGTGINQLTEQLAQEMRNQVANLCKTLGSSNWILATTWLINYQTDVQKKRYAIRELANRLKEGNDLTGREIEEGVRKTLENNLTRSNRDAFDTNAPNFQFFNSMENIDMTNWLVARGLYPTIPYLDTELKSDGDCDYFLTILQRVPFHSGDPIYGPTIQDLARRFGLPSDETQIQNPDNSYPVIGYEKNPWYMVYTGVSVTTSPEEPFSPLNGYRPALKAKAFAKPFGGKIGPWMYPSWSRGQPRSTGSADQQTDRLLPLSIGSTNLAPGTNLPLDEVHVPNYSRYPGDLLGLRSAKALGIYSDLFNQLLSQVLSQGSHLLSYDYFIRVDLNATNDSLMWDIPNHGPPPARMLEVLAVAPDLFDITYYSIDPQFYLNYIAFIGDNFFQNHPFVRDFGARINSPDPSYLEGFGVFDQIHWINNGTALHPPPLPLTAFRQGEWFVKEWTHLLTSWVPKNIDQSPMDSDLFGKCNNDDDDVVENMREAIPGSCALGGRTGYSVKLISKKYLEANDLNLGGSAGGTGSIENPPPF